MASPLPFSDSSLGASSTATSSAVSSIASGARPRPSRILSRRCSSSSTRLRVISSSASSNSSWASRVWLNCCLTVSRSLANTETSLAKTSACCSSAARSRDKSSACASKLLRSSRSCSLCSTSESSWVSSSETRVSRTPRCWVRLSISVRLPPVQAASSRVTRLSKLSNLIFMILSFH